MRFAAISLSVVAGAITGTLPFRGNAFGELIRLAASKLNLLRIISLVLSRSPLGSHHQRAHSVDSVQGQVPA